MIASLHGKVEAISSEWAVINVNGVGFQVYLPTSTLSELGTVGTEANLYTHLYLQTTEADFVPWAKHRDEYQSLGPLPWPPRCHHCRSCRPHP